MKTIFTWAVCCLLAAAQAQTLNYAKLKVPTVDGGGKVFDAKGNRIGMVNHDGEVYNAEGKMVAKFDAFRNLIELETENNIGKEDANGNFLAVQGKKVISWKLFPPENQGLVLCLIKDKSGEIVATVNKSFKEYGTTAVYYLNEKYGVKPEVPVAAPAAPKPQATATPAEAKPSSKSADKKPTAKPAEKKPIDKKPAANAAKPVEKKAAPTSNKPADKKPTAKPADKKTTTSKPADKKPTAKPADKKPSSKPTEKKKPQ